MLRRLFINNIKKKPKQQQFLKLICAIWTTLTIYYIQAFWWLYVFFFYLAGMQSATEECHCNSLNSEEPQNRWLTIQHVLMIYETLIPEKPWIL